MATSSASSTFVASDGDGYERLMGRWSQRLAVPFLDFVGLSSHERVLDVGCGTGHLAVAASFADYWAPYDGKDGPGAEYVATLSDTQRTALREAVRAAYLDGEVDGPRSYAAVAWAIKGTTPGQHP